MTGFLERNLSRHEQKWLKICLLTMISLLEVQSRNEYFPSFVLIEERFFSGFEVAGTIIALALEMAPTDTTNEDLEYSGIFFSFSR